MINNINSLHLNSPSKSPREEASTYPHATLRSPFYFAEGDEKVNRFVQEKFKVIQTNVSDLREAKVICFGENHDNKQHQMNNSALIDALCTQEDMILTEAETDNIGVQVTYMKQNLMIKGWDKRSAKDKNFIVLSRRLSRISHIWDNLTFLSMLAVGEFLRRTFSLRVSLVSFPVITFLGALGMAHLYSATRGFYELGSYANDLSKKNPLTTTDPLKTLEVLIGAAREDMNNCVRELWEGFPLRNQHMCQKIQENLLPRRKIYVIAGKAHLIPSGLSTPEASREFQKEGYRVLLEYLQTQKFAILIPKEE